MLVKYEESGLIYPEYDKEIYDILKDAKKVFDKTRTTELEIETTLILARYLANFSS